MTRDQLDKLFADPLIWFEQYGQPVLDQLLKHERIKPEQISAKLGIDPDVAFETLRQLNLLELADAPLNTESGRRWRPSERAKRSVVDSRYRAKKRNCLFCRGMFLSLG